VRLLLFDIDGTLLHARGAGRRAVKAALERVYGTVGAIDRYDLGGKTDQRIVFDVLESAGLSREAVRERLDEFFDAYARGDMLKQYNQLDNAEFLDALKSRGFLIADQARSNYMYTRLSLSSFLNMRYLDGDIKDFGPNPPRGSINPMLREFDVARRFKQLGYT
jgi:beta-phosphoglucomutase-like phosphatase (HAD superfamily)